MGGVSEKRSDGSIFFFDYLSTDTKIIGLAQSSSAGSGCGPKVSFVFAYNFFVGGAWAANETYF